MRRTISTLGLLAVFLPVESLAAQRRGSQEWLQAQLAAKQQKSFVKHGGWMLDYDAARARAAKEGKVLLVYFTRTFAP